MNKITIIIISIICIAIITTGIYATYFQRGVPTQEVRKKSIRNGSIGHLDFEGGFEYGK